MKTNVWSQRLLLSALLILPLAACGDSGTGPGEEDVSGTYVLDPAPVVLHNDEHYKFEIVSMRIVLERSSSYIFTVHSRLTDAGEEPVDNEQTGRGTWVKAGTALTLTSSDDGNIIIAKLEQGVLTLADDGMEFTLKKQ